MKALSEHLPRTAVPRHKFRSDHIEFGPAAPDQVGVAVGSGIDFVDADQIWPLPGRQGRTSDHRGTRRRSRVCAATSALKTGLLLAPAFLAVLSLAFTRDSESGAPEEEDPDKAEAKSHA